jgi:hypothetical protein
MSQVHPGLQKDMSSSMEPVSVTLFWKRICADIIKNPKVRLTWIFRWAKFNDKCSFKRKDEGDLRHKKAIWPGVRVMPDLQQQGHSLLGIRLLLFYCFGFWSMDKNCNLLQEVVDMILWGSECPWIAPNSVTWNNEGLSLTLPVQVELGRPCRMWPSFWGPMVFLCWPLTWHCWVCHNKEVRTKGPSIGIKCLCFSTYFCCITMTPTTDMGHSDDQWTRIWDGSDIRENEKYLPNCGATDLLASTA